jgi:hypothetical protein
MIQKMSLNLKKCKELYTHLFTALLRVEFFPTDGRHSHTQQSSTSFVRGFGCVRPVHMLSAREISQESARRAGFSLVLARPYDDLVLENGVMNT